MPPKRHKYDNAMRDFPWVEAIDNTCLKTTVKEALLTRDIAVGGDGDGKIIDAGDKTLEQIEFGRVTGDLACKKAATAMRKYEEAYMSVRRKGHALRKSKRRTRRK